MLPERSCHTAIAEGAGPFSLCCAWLIVVNHCGTRRRALTVTDFRACSGRPLRPPGMIVDVRVWSGHVQGVGPTWR
jgi:hypothetical protein